MVSNSIQHDKTKHIEICLCYAKSQGQVPDVFTNGQTMAHLLSSLNKVSYTSMLNLREVQNIVAQK